MKIQSYRQLDVWKKGVEIADLVYKITDTFPPEERFGLATQMQRAAISIPSNIAEGYARQHRKEYQQFCHVALGSCAALETQAVIAKSRKYASETLWLQLDELLDHEGRMLTNLLKGLRA